ncbi:MAG TPA: hypothetical protein VFV65_02990 [Gemmatimonadales bacterium]|nr:hypothetical protein [Gemmatimonadales bacterium]
MTRPLRLALGAAGLVAFAACTEDFTTPGSCPQTCPGGTVVIRDTVIVATLDGDSSYAGYVLAGQGTGLLASTAEPTDQYLAALRFGRLPDSVRVKDSSYTFVVDSVAISLGVLARDANALGIALQVFRAPASLDSGVTFSDIASYLTPGNFLDSMPVPDTLANGNLRIVFAGADLVKVEIPPADSGVLAIAVGVTADTATGVEIGNITAATFLPRITWYINVPGVDSADQPTPIQRVPTFTTYAEQNPPVPDPDQLQVGGTPSSRSIIRFSVPDSVLIGVQILRAELLMTPAEPIEGVPNIGTTITARGVLSDQGAKSPLVPVLTATTALTVGSSDSVTVEVIELVRAWQTTVNPPAQAFFLSLQPEGSSFTRPIFSSTRSPAGAPRLRITYVAPIDFEEP